VTDLEHRLTKLLQIEMSAKVTETTSVHKCTVGCPRGWRVCKLANWGDEADHKCDHKCLMHGGVCRFSLFAQNLHVDKKQNASNRRRRIRRQNEEAARRGRLWIEAEERRLEEETHRRWEAQELAKAEHRRQQRQDMEYREKLRRHDKEEKKKRAASTERKAMAEKKNAGNSNSEVKKEPIPITFVPPLKPGGRDVQGDIDAIRQVFRSSLSIPADSFF
jgi:hypothetical protein